MNNIKKHFPELVLPWFDYEFQPRTVAQLTSWAQLQADLYLQPAFSTVQNLGHPFNILGTYWVFVRNLLNAANDLASLPRDGDQTAAERLVASISSSATELFFNLGLPPADSSVGVLLGKLAKDDPSGAAAAVFSLSRTKRDSSYQPNTWTPLALRGIALGAALSAASLTQKGGSAKAKAAEQEQKLHRLALVELQDQTSDTASRAKAVLDEWSNDSAAAKSAFEKWLSSAQAESNQQINECKTELDAFKKLVKTQIALQAPVEYWTDKAVRHENLAFFYGLLTIGLMFTLSACSFGFRGEIRDFFGNQPTPSVVSVFIGVIVVTFMFWGVRLLVRLFLSNQHLGGDARERVTMVQTYLALNEAGLAPKDNELAPILVALFRPASDGMVKDEAMPPVLVELLTRSK